MAALTGKDAIETIGEQSKPIIPFMNEIAGKISDVKEKIANQ